MKELIPKDDFGIFADMKQTARVDSLYVAVLFEREHRNILRAIQNLECSDEFRLLNFEQSTYKNEQGKRQPCCFMTRDGFMFLVMGFTGKKAAQLKEAYIQRFNEMEEHIKVLSEMREEFPLLTEMITKAHKEPKFYHYSTEVNMINKIVIGMNAKQFCQAHQLPEKTNIRPYLTTEQVKLMQELQVLDCGYLDAGLDYETRKKKLEQHAKNKKESSGI